MLAETHVLCTFLISTTWFYQEEEERNNRSVMPLDVLGYTRATMTNSTSFLFLVRKDVGNLFNVRRDGARLLQLLIFNEESLVCAVHQTAQNASLPFVHTARRTYRLDDPARCLDLFHFRKEMK